jgi:hypothetical protein
MRKAFEGRSGKFGGKTLRKGLEVRFSLITMKRTYIWHWLKRQLGLSSQ